MRLDDATITALGRREVVDSFREMAANTTHSLRKTSEELLVNAGGEELLDALRTDLVSLRPMIPAGDINRADFAQAYTQELERLLRDGRRHLLLDDFNTTMARHLLEEGRVQPAPRTVPNAWEAAIGTGVIARLPSLHDAPLDELLDVRRELDGPLSRYRGASVAAMGEKVQTSPFDADASAEVDHLYRTEVVPAAGSPAAKSTSSANRVWLAVNVSVVSVRCAMTGSLTRGALQR